MRKQSFLLVIAILLSVISPGLVPNRAEAAGGTVTKSYIANADVMELRGQPEYEGIYDHDGDGLLYVGMSNNDGFINVRNRMATSFNLGVPEGNIVSAELVLTVAAVIRNPNHTLYMEVRGSDMNDLNNVIFPTIVTNAPYADKFTAMSSSEVPMGTYLQNQSITLNVKSAVDAYTGGNDRKITFVLNGNETDADSGRFLIYSLENANAAFRPKLVVTYETGTANTIPTGSFTINEGAATNSSVANLSIMGTDVDAGDSVTHMRFANSSANLSAASWLPFSNTATFSLSGGDGAKTIYMQVKDSKNGISDTSSQSILLDQTAPTGTLIINDGAAFTRNYIVTLSGSYSDGSGSGVEQARLSNISGSWQTSWFNIADLNGRSWVLPAGEGVKTTYVQYKDKVGNLSAGTISSMITVDTIPPVVSNVEHNKTYNKAMTPTFNEGSGLLNGSPFISGTEIAMDGTYTLIVTDAAGNTTTVTFKIDTAAPVVTGVTNGGIYKGNVIVTFNKGTATLNGAAFTSGTTVTLDGIYTLVVTDLAGNVKTVSFEIDKTAPIITGVTHDGSYKAPVTVSFNEGTATLNGAAFVSGMQIGMDGSYTLVVTDAAGNVTTVNFVIDRVAPIVTGVADGGIYKDKVIVSFNKGTAILNGTVFTSVTEVDRDGSYKLVVTDSVGNVTTVNFVIDKVAPIVTGVSDGGVYKDKVTVSFDEGTAKLNGNAFTSGTEVNQDGSYKLVVTDAAGNVTTVNFVIDKVAPIVTGVSDGGIYKDKVTVSFDEGIAKLNGNPFTSGTEVNQDGSYKLIVTDAAGNVTTVNFVIDRVAPVVTGVVDGGMYKNKVTVSFDEGIAKLNGDPFTSGTEVIQDGVYKLVVTDAAGNVTTMNFVIDKIAPIITGVADGGKYKEKVTVVFNEGTAMLNGAPFTSGTEVVTDGSYKLVVTDAAGNVTTVNFVIDKVAPIVTGVADGGMYKDKVTVSFDEGTAKLNGDPFTSGTEVIQDGVYKLIVTDTAGNVTTVNFVIDKVAPIVTGVADGGMYKDKVTISFDKGTAKLNGDPFTSGTEVNQDGSYKLVVTDAAGNLTTVNFVIDNVAPIVTGVADGGMYKDKVTVSFDEGTAKLNGAAFTSGTEVVTDGMYTLVVTDTAGNVTTVNFVIDKVAPVVTGVADGEIYKDKVIVSFNKGTAILNGTAFTSATEVDRDGSYKLVVTDSVGNVTTVNFVIDKVAPIVTGVSDGGVYKDKVTVSFNEGTATLNGTVFTSGTEVNQDGVYKLVVTDTAGNVTTVNFVIDKVAPIVTGVADGGMYKDKVSVSFNEGTAKLNGDPFTSGTEVIQDGVYKLVVTDTAGNVTTVNFIIDKVAPIVTGVADGGIYKDKVTVSFNEGTATLNGTAFTSGTEVDQDGVYKLVVTDSVGNVTTVNFVIDKVAPVVTGVTDGGVYKDKVTVSFDKGTAKLNGDPFTSGTEVIQDGSYKLVVTDTAGNVTTVNFVIDKVAPIVTGVADGGIYKDKVTVIFNKGTATLNGTAFTSGMDVNQDGSYKLVVTDRAGNATTIDFLVDTTAPTGTLIIQAGSEWTNVKDTTLTLTSDDSSKGSGVVEMRFSSNGTDWSSWQPSAATKAWSLGAGDGEKSVFVQFKDKAGNVSHSIIQDKIKLDQTIPTGMITINSGATVTSSKEVKLTLTSSDGDGSGVTEMRFSADKLTWSAWENVLLTKNWILDGDYGSKLLYVQYRDAAGNSSVANAASIEYQASGGGSNNGSGNTESNSDITISIGNKSEQMVKATVMTIEGKKVTTVIFEEAQLKELLKGAGDKPVITITVHNQSDIVNWEINAELLSVLESNNAIIQLMSENASYSFPMDQVHSDEWLNQFGSNASLKDITLKMEIIHAPNSEFVYKDMGNGQITLIAPPVRFSVKAYFGSKEIELNQFDTFVERRIALPEGIDPKRITTGVKLISDGSLIHIPTKVIEEDGRYYAVLSSMTNSMYGLIYHQKSFSDVATHWAKTSINDLASRLIINGADEQRFLPNNEITRAEFTAIIIRALGLSSAAKSISFTDISEKDWYHSAAQIAYSYGLVDGYSDGSFKPNEKITRQEAMVILSRAMKLADLYNELGNVQQQNLLNGFKDNTKIAAWARQAAALTIQFGVVGGYNGELLPQKNITRAETAAIIQRLLQKAEFV